MMCYMEGHVLQLACSITILKCIRISRIASGSICNPLMVPIVSFLQKTVIKCHAKYHFQVPSLHGKYEDVLEGETSIAVELSHNLP